MISPQGLCLLLYQSEEQQEGFKQPALSTHSSEKMGREKEMVEGEVMESIEKKRREKDDEQACFSSRSTVY